MANNCRVAKDVMCQSCGAQGHIQSAYGPEKARSTEESAPGKTNWPSNINSSIGSRQQRSMPRLILPFLLWSRVLAIIHGQRRPYCCDWRVKGNQGILLKCCPDSAATQSIVCERIACQANLVIHPPKIGMVSLTGHTLNIIGESNVCFTFDRLQHETAILVASDLSGDRMLVAWQDLQPLEIISLLIFPQEFWQRSGKSCLWIS